MAIRLWTEDDYPDAPETGPARCERCGRYCEDSAALLGFCKPCHRKATSGDPRDLTPDPPAMLDIPSVLKMRAMVKDAAENGDRPWPYKRDAA